MHKKRKRAIWLVAGGFACLVLLSWRMFTSTKVSPHEGDGAFTDLDLTLPVCGLPLLKVPAYSISFPGFDMGKAYEATYEINRLSAIGKPCRLYLAVEDPDRRWFMRDREIRQLSGRLLIEVLDSRGNVLGRAEDKLGEYVWGYWLGALRLYYMPEDQRENFPPEFIPDPLEKYTCRIKYTGDPQLNSLNGYLYLQCGPRE